MSQIFDFLFGQYADYAVWDVALEIIAATLGLVSVWCAKQNHIAVFPTGMISTAIYVYLLFQWTLLEKELRLARFYAETITKISL